jgi:chromatin assembly factor 1 subunit A
MRSSVHDCNSVVLQAEFAFEFIPTMDTMEVSTPVALVAPQKRPLDDAEPRPSTPTRAISSNASTPLTTVSSMATPSPLKNASIPLLLGTNAAVAGDTAITLPGTAPTPGSTQPAKRRKLTAQERKDRDAEKEVKAKALADRKAQKEAEDKAKAEQKAQKEEEKRARDEERRKKNEEKEEKKRAKELKQQQEEEEKRKKERVSRTPHQPFDRRYGNQLTVPSSLKCD